MSAQQSPHLARSPGSSSIQQLLCRLPRQLVPLRKEKRRNHRANNARVFPSATEKWQGQAEAGQKELDEVKGLREFRATLAQTKLLIIQGVDALKQQKLDEALSLFQKSIEQSPELPTGHYYLGVNWDRKNDPKRACAAYERALELKPDYAQAHTSLGLLDWRQNDSARALEEFHQAVMSDPDLAEAHYNFGLALAQSERPDEAVRELKEAVTLDPNFAEGHNNLGLVLLQAGDTSKAKIEFLEAVRLKPRYAQAHYNLALALHQVGKDSESRLELEGVPNCAGIEKR